MKLLLDTCTFLWLVEGGERLSAAARGAYRDPENDVYLSAVSTWEIAILASLGRLNLPEPLERFVPTERDRLQVLPLPLDEAATLHLAKLPALHRDPFDRMLVCQALQSGLTLLTPDEQVRQYPVVSTW